MARKPLQKSISARVSESDYAKMIDYSDAADIALADLLRIGAQEYIANHPVIGS